MNRIRSFILTPRPRPVANRRVSKTTRMCGTRARQAVPSRRPVRLRGRELTQKQRVLSGWSGRFPDILLTLLFITISFAINVQQVEKTEFHPDESRWMNRAYYARELGDPFGPTWQEYTTTIGQPPLGSVVMGIGLAIQGHDLDGTAVWDFAYGRDWNERTGAMPNDEDRFAARRTNVVIGALVTGAVFVLGRLLTNRVGGSMAAIFLAWHPLHIVLSTQALSDQTLSLLLALIFISGWFFAKKPTWARAIALGVLLGLGGSVKLTPMLLAGPLAVFGLIRWFMHRDAKSREYAFMMLAQPVIALATFVISYPYLWPNPITRTWKLYEFRATEMDDQNAAWPGASVADPLDSLSRFGKKLTETHSTSQKALVQIYEWLGIDRVPVGLDFIPAVAGIVLLIWWVARKGFWTPAAMVALLMGAEAGALVLGMKTDFYRYHLPIVVIMAACIGVSTGTLWSSCAQMAHSWRARLPRVLGVRSTRTSPTRQARPADSQVVPAQTSGELTR
jgi:4-amino-4-deoxy-L-arabinose transferase-like glycosyltransferase